MLSRKIILDDPSADKDICLMMEPVSLTTSPKMLLARAKKLIPPMLEKFHKGEPLAKRFVYTYLWKTKGEKEKKIN